MIKIILHVLMIAAVAAYVPASAQESTTTSPSSTPSSSTGTTQSTGTTGGAQGSTDTQQGSMPATQGSTDTTGGATGGSAGGASTDTQQGSTSSPQGSTGTTGGATGGAAGGASTDTQQGTTPAQSTGTSQSTGTAGGATGGAAPQAKKATLPFVIYVDQGAKDNHYTPSGWMGDYGDIKMNPGNTQSPHSGKTSIEFKYSAKMTNNAGWAGVFWQNPANNWGDKPGGGFNLTGAKKLTFWAKGAKGGEKISEFKVGGITGEFPDSDQASLGPVQLTNQWKQYTIDLAGKDLSTIIGAFAWSASKDDNPEGFTIYFDDIIFE